MERSVNDFVAMYTNWLKENMKSETLKTEAGEFVLITTPFLDRHNDHIQIYVQKHEYGFSLTDAGYTINDLAMSGCDIMSSPKRKNILNIILNGLGIQLKGEELRVDANISNFAQKKHCLLQAIMAVNDMFVMSRAQISSVFFEDVQSFLDANEVRYIMSVPFFGASGLPHTFDFAIPASKKKPERLLRTINSATREKIDSVLFSWNDTRVNRKQDSELFVIVNDLEKQLKQEYSSALISYGAKVVSWSQREKSIADLVA